MCAKVKGSLRIVFLRGRERLARPERFELPTYCSGGNRSIQLSYGRDGLSSVYIQRFAPSIGRDRREKSYKAQRSRMVNAGCSRLTRSQFLWLRFETC